MEFIRVSKITVELDQDVLGGVQYDLIEGVVVHFHHSRGGLAHTNVSASLAIDEVDNIFSSAASFVSRSKSARN